jgi:hypothetical protein
MKTVIFLFILALISVTSAFANADEGSPCPTLRLQNLKWPALHYHQPGNSLCYAVAMSDLLSAKMNQPVSAIALANSVERAQDTLKEKIRAKFYRDNSFLHRFSIIGKSYLSAFDILKKNGVCAYSIVDRLRDQPEIKNIFLDDLFSDLETLRKSNPQNFATRLHQLFDPLSASFVNSVLPATQDITTPLIDILVDKSCPARIDLRQQDLNSVTITDDNESQAASTINSVLQSNTPIGIGYDVQMITHLQYANRESVNHASTLVGQYMKGDVCTYVIRATDTETCQESDPAVPCHDGYFEVPRQQALQIIHDIVWFK